MSDVKFPSKILGYLYLGGKQDAKAKNILQHLKIKYILNATPPRSVDPESGCPSFFEKEKSFVYSRIPVFDNRGEDLLQYMDQSFRFIEEGKHYGGVLVHCHKGVSRSSSFVIGYLMRKSAMSLDEALDYVKAIRPIVMPNLAFMAQLRAYEVILDKERESSNELFEKKCYSDDNNATLTEKPNDIVLSTGSRVEPILGPSVRPTIGILVGPSIGPTIGLSVGPSIGSTVGPYVGAILRPSIGGTVGPSIGATLGQSSGPHVNFASRPCLHDIGSEPLVSSINPKCKSIGCETDEVSTTHEAELLTYRSDASNSSADDIVSKIIIETDDSRVIASLSPFKKKRDLLQMDIRTSPELKKRTTCTLVQNNSNEDGEVCAN